jgi:hypothetical protein
MLTPQEARAPDGTAGPDRFDSKESAQPLGESQRKTSIRRVGVFEDAFSDPS